MLRDPQSNEGGHRELAAMTRRDRRHRTEELRTNTHGRAMSLEGALPPAPAAHARPRGDTEKSSTATGGTPQHRRRRPQPRGRRAAPGLVSNATLSTKKRSVTDSTNQFLDSGQIICRSAGGWHQTVGERLHFGLLLPCEAWSE